MVQIARIRISLLIAAVMLCGCTPVQLRVELPTPVRVLEKSATTEAPASGAPAEPSVSLLLSDAHAVGAEGRFRLRRRR